MNFKRRNILKGMAAIPLATAIGDNAMATSGVEFHVPPEENVHELTFMQWPNSRRVYSDSWFLGQAQQTIAEIANTISQFEPVIILADQSHHTKIRKLISSKVELWDVPTEDLWCRDAGPLFAVSKSGNRAVSQIQFNGWGNKQTHKYDGQVASIVAQNLEFPLIPSGLNGEPGGVEQDGHGMLLAHESSWVIANRNPGMTRDEVGQRLLKAYGAEQVIWAPGVRGLDITDYHIDSLARFTGPGKVLINLPMDADYGDPFQAAALETRDILVASGLEVQEILEPNYRRVKSRDFVASYANYYVCNGAVIASQFGDKETDLIAKNALKRHFPDREIVMLNTDVLGELGGGIHCATQQLPA